MTDTMSELREIIHLLFTAEARVQPQVQYTGSVEEISALGQVFLRILQFSNAKSHSTSDELSRLSFGAFKMTPLAV
jgi:hypothetical protein